MSISIKTYEKTFSNLTKYDLELLDVYIEDDALSPQFFSVRFLPDYISYGRHAFSIAFKESETEYEFVKNSLVLFEFKDRDGKIIYSESVGPFRDGKTYNSAFNNYGEYGKSGFGYVEVKKDPQQTYYEITDDIGYMTIVGELSGVPDEWKGKYNVKLTLPVNIRKDIENTSPLIFLSKPNLDVRLLSTSQTEGARGAQLASLIKTFAHASFDNLNTIGGSIDTINLEYLSDASGKSSFELLDKFKLSPVELLTSSHSKVDYLPAAGAANMSQPGVPIGRFTELNNSGVHSTGLYDWNSYRGSDRVSTNVVNWTSDNTLYSVLSGSAQLKYNYAGGIDGGVGKLIRRTVEDETFDFKYNVSGSGEISIWYSNNINHFLNNSAGQIPCPFISQSLMTLAYSASFRNFNPSGSINEDGIFNSYSGSFMNGTLITSASSNYKDPSGDDTQIIKDNFTIPSGSYFAVYIHPISSSAAEYLYISNLSIKHEQLPGKSIPFFYDKIELAGFAKRNENLQFKSSYYSPDGGAGISVLDPSIVYTSSFSPFEYFPEGFSIERGAGAGYAVNDGGATSPNRGISLGSKFSNITTGSFNEQNTGWAHGSSSIGVWGESAFGHKLSPTTFGALYPGNYNSTGTPKLYDVFTRANTVGGLFVAARHSSSTDTTIGLQVGAWESSSAGWNTASGADKLWSARFESGDVYIADDLFVSGNITSQQYIISSSTSYYTQSFHVGSTQFGDTAGDTHTFIGSITASADISASGEVSANTIVVDSTISHIGDSNTKITFDDDDINLSVAGKTAIDITWDGNGGGDIREITFNEGDNDFDVRMEGLTDANLLFTNAGTNRVGIGTNDPDSKLEVNGDITATNITASGHISSSGNLYVNNIYKLKRLYANSNDTQGYIDFDTAGTFRLKIANSDSDVGTTFFGGAAVGGGAYGGGYIDQTTGNAYQLRIGGNEKLEVNTTGVDVTGNITASADISASNTVYAKNLILSGGTGVFTSQSLAAGGSGGGGSMTSFQLEDDSGDEVTISDAKEVKFIGSGITINWTDVTDGTDGDPYDMTFTVDSSQTGISSILNNSLVVGYDAHNFANFSSDNIIGFNVDDAERFQIKPSGLNVVGHITASGDITSSAKMIATGDITSSAKVKGIGGVYGGKAGSNTVADRGSLVITENGSQDYWQMGANASGFMVWDYVLSGAGSTGQKMMLGYDGKLGIGHTGNGQPGEALTVQGNISSSGTIVGSNLSNTNSGDVTLSGTPDYITISNQVITRNTIDIGDDTNLAVSDTSGQTGINMTLSGDTISGVVSGLDTDDNVTFNHISASGELTSSAGLILGNVHAGTYVSASALGSLEISGSGAASLDVQGSITSSLNISSSLDVHCRKVDAVDGDFDGTLEADAITVGGIALNTVIAGVTVTNATNATNSSHVLVTDNENANENNLITFVENATDATGNVGLEMDGDFHYNPSTGTVSATTFNGALTGNADTATSATTATNANHVNVADNENTDEDNLIPFIENASATGNVGLESDGDFHYNPSTGKVTATAFTSRFQIASEMFVRHTAANRRYVKGGHSGMSGTQLTNAAGSGMTSDPDGVSVTYKAAAQYKNYIAPRACKLVRVYATIHNYNNDDDIKLNVYKGTAVSNSDSGITLTKIGSEIAPSMDEDKTYFVSQDISSGNALSANDFLIVTSHVSSYTSPIYAHIYINFELEYT